MKRLTILLSALVIASSSFAADSLIVLKAARLIDGRADAPISPAVVVVRGNKIESVGSSNVPQGAETIDLGDVTLLPGLIDAHTHILLQGDITNEDYDNQLFKQSMPYRALLASRGVKIALEHGFTAMRDVETEGAMYTDVDVKKAINNGVIPGPRMQVSGRAMSVTGGYGPSGYAPEITFPKGVQIVDGVENARKAAREQIGNGADWIKVYADRSYYLDKEGKLSSIPNFTLDEFKAVVDEAHRLRHKVAAHAMARPGLENAINAGVDSIEHGIAIPDDLLDRMKAQGIYLCPTLTVTEYVAAGRGGLWAKTIPDFHHDTFARAVRKGVKIALGTDVGGFPWTEINQAREFSYETKFGMTPMQAIKSGTIVAAQLMGWDDRIGTIEPGKFADIVAVPGNPLSDISSMEKVSFVMKDGAIVKR
jgi:imidazolonepropionase-like amidohydrolase